MSPFNAVVGAVNSSRGRAEISAFRNDVLLPAQIHSRVRQRCTHALVRWRWVTVRPDDLELARKLAEQYLRINTGVFKSLKLAKSQEQESA